MNENGEMQCFIMKYVCYVSHQSKLYKISNELNKHQNQLEKKPTNKQKHMLTR